MTLALATELPVTLGSRSAALAMAVAVARDRRSYAVDTVLGVTAHAALAAGLVALSFLHGVRIDLLGYLFGDILAVSRADLAVIWAGRRGDRRAPRLALEGSAAVDAERGPRRLGGS